MFSGRRASLLPFSREGCSPRSCPVTILIKSRAVGIWPALRYGWLVGSLLADALVVPGRGLHLGGDEFDRLGHRDILEELGGDRTLLPGLYRALVTDRLGPGRGRRGDLAQGQRALQPVEFLALARAKHLAFEPGQLRAQGRVLPLQGEVLGIKLFGRRHRLVSIIRILIIQAFFSARTRLFGSRPSGRCPRAAWSGLEA